MLNAPISPRQRGHVGPQPPRSAKQVSDYHLKLARAVCRRPGMHLLVAWLLDWGGPETIADLLEATWASHLSYDDSLPADRAFQLYDYQLSRAVLQEFGGQLALIQDHMPA